VLISIFHIESLKLRKLQLPKNGNIFKLRHHADPGKFLLSKWNEDKQQKRGTSLLILSVNFPQGCIKFPLFFSLIDSPAECRREEKSKTSVTRSKLVHAIGVHGKICRSKADLSTLHLLYLGRAASPFTSSFHIASGFEFSRAQSMLELVRVITRGLGLQCKSGQGTQLFSYIYPFWEGKWKQWGEVCWWNWAAGRRWHFKGGKMQMGIYWRLGIGKGRRELNRGGAYVPNSHRAVYTYVAVGVILSVPLLSLPISKEVKRVYRFLFHIHLSKSLNHTSSFPPQVSKWIQEDRNKWECKKDTLFHTLTIVRLNASLPQLHGRQWSWN